MSMIKAINGRRAVMQLLVVIAAFCFWGVAYPFALAWHEQFQLFLFDETYALERLTVPGGAAAYIAEFLVQFYNHPYLGAGLIALLYLLLQTVIYRLMKREAGFSSDELFVLSFLPSLYLWYIMGDENVMLAFPVSLLCALGAMLFYPSGRWQRTVFSLLAVPLVYWMAGPLVFLLALLMLVREVRCAGFRLAGWGAGLGQLAYALAVFYGTSGLVAYPLRRLAGGIFYYRIPEVLLYSFLAMAILCLLLVVLAGPVGKRSVHMKRESMWVSVGAGILAVASALLIPTGFDAKKYELIEYDYLVRLQRWEAIVQKAEHQQPDLPMSVCATNLALGMTGQLGERAFQFFQHGAEGLLPPFTRDFNSTQLTGEAYFQLGLINTAQRYAFESMEAIPNYNKSGRMVKRLAETNLINGQYKVAEKYLKMLKKTVFYRKWAQSRLEMVADTSLIVRHPLYGRLRKVRLQEDFLFSETEMDKTCGKLFSYNPENTLAMQFLLTYPLLARDMDAFLTYFGYVRSRVNYNPTVCQEAVAFACMMRKMEIPPGTVSQSVMERFKSFAQAYSFGGKNSAEVEAFRNTLWYYLMKQE